MDNWLTGTGRWKLAEILRCTVFLRCPVQMYKHLTSYFQVPHTHTVQTFDFMYHLYVYYISCDKYLKKQYTAKDTIHKNSANIYMYKHTQYQRQKLDGLVQGCGGKKDAPKHVIIVIPTRTMGTRQARVSSMIHLARPTVLPIANIVFAWNLFCFEKWGRTDGMCKNYDHDSWLWVGLVDQK